MNGAKRALLQAPREAELINVAYSLLNPELDPGLPHSLP
jgi:hypothetical protein